MQTQLTLRVALSDHASFDNFYVGSNNEIVTAVHDFIEDNGDLIFLFGDQGSGKTHLLYAAQRDALEKSRQASYLSLADEGVARHVTSFVVHGELVCIDDVHRVAGCERLERVLFNLIEQQRQLNGSVLLAADKPLQAVSFVMPDLVSRLSSGASYRVQTLTDHQKEEAMRLRAQHRGIELSDDVISYVMKRFSRNPSSLFALLDKIDKASLSTQRRVTIPFIKQLEIDES